MSNEKKNIEVANGTAEDGDRVILLDEMDGYPSGMIGMDPNDEGIWTFYPDHGGMANGWPQNEELREEIILDFSPNDALEVVEEEKKAAFSIFSKSQKGSDIADREEIARTAIDDFCHELKQRIQQKRKGE